MTDVAVAISPKPPWNAHKPLRYSASRLKTWMTCAMQAHLKYDLRIPAEKSNAKAVFGTCIHAALEHYNQYGNVDQAVALFKDLWQNPEKVGAPAETFWWPKMTSFGGLKERGVALLRTFHDQCEWDKREIIATEHPFLVPFGAYELTGYVDLLEVRRSGRGEDILRVCDYKTSSRRPNMAELALDVQFTVYMWAVEQDEFWFGHGNADFPAVPNAAWVREMTRDLRTRAIWIHLWDHKEIDAGPRVDTDFLRLYRVCQEIEKADAAGIHVPRIGDPCVFCDFREPCAMQVHIPTADELASQPGAWI